MTDNERELLAAIPYLQRVASRLFGYSVVRNWLRDREDVFQELCLQAWKRGFMDQLPDNVSRLVHMTRKASRQVLWESRRRTRSIAHDSLEFDPVCSYDWKRLAEARMEVEIILAKYSQEDKAILLRETSLESVATAIGKTRTTTKTRSANLLKALREGLKNKRPALSKRAKLTLDQVREIKASLSAGESLASLGRKYSVHYSTIYEIRQGKIWKDV